MRRAGAAAVWLLATGCGVPTYSREGIDGTDLQSRYPIALEEARRGLAVAAAVTLVLFTAWLAGDLLVRKPDRRQQGGALVTAAALVGLLTAAWLVVDTAGEYPEGRLYQVAANLGLWLGLVALVAGIAWMVRGFRTGPGDRGEAVWGLFLVLLGLFVAPMVFLSSFSLWLCTGSC